MTSEKSEVIFCYDYFKMKSKKYRIVLVVLAVVLLAIGGVAYYLVSVQKVLSPIEIRYADKTPSFSFTDTVAYPPASGGTFYIKATTAIQQTGNCTFVFTKGTEKRIEVTQYIEHSWVCDISKPYSFFGLDGKWDVFILLKSNDGTFATKTLKDISIDSKYKPKEVTFTSVDYSYKKVADGTGLHSFKVDMSENVTGECYLYFFAEQGKSIGGIDIVEKRVKVNAANTCTLDISAKDFKAKGWYTYSLYFKEPYNQYHFTKHDGRVLVWY